MKILIITRVLVTLFYENIGYIVGMLIRILTQNIGRLKFDKKSSKSTKNKTSPSQYCLKSLA